MNDEIVDEIRRNREAHAARFGYDLKAIVEDLRKTESFHLAEGHPHVEPPLPIRSSQQTLGTQETSHRRFRGDPK